MTDELAPNVSRSDGAHRLEGPEALLTGEWSIADLPWITAEPEADAEEEQPAGPRPTAPPPPSKRAGPRTEFAAGAVAPLGPFATRTPLITYPKPRRPVAPTMAGGVVNRCAATLPPLAEREAPVAAPAPAPVAAATTPTGRHRNSFIALAAVLAFTIGYPVWTALLRPTAADAAAPPTVPAFLHEAAPSDTAGADAAAKAPSPPSWSSPPSTLPPELAATLAGALPAAPPPPDAGSPTSAAAPPVVVSSTEPPDLEETPTPAAAPPVVVSTTEPPGLEETPAPAANAISEETRRRADALRDALEAQRSASEPARPAVNAPSAVPARRAHRERDIAPPGHAAPRPGRANTNAVQRITTFTYDAQNIFFVATAPLRATDLVLERGELLTSQPTAGDAARWVISVVPGGERTHIFVKPLRSGLRTNLTLTTDRRTYFLELASHDNGSYMAGVEWRYPADDAARRRERLDEAARDRQSTTAIADVQALRFDYRIEVIEGEPPWKPTMAFDDGNQTFIRFSRPMTAAPAPVLLILRSGATRNAKYVNYRVKGDLYVVDRIIDAAELRLGNGDRGQEVVRITRAR